ncbi:MULTISPECIES: nucleoside-diphosphate sugar epimerase/dehydratase [unclassified Roseateles]|uniref:polysaccharide biosynthesis protein n=1 Tax=unclassified Roseateles TaxID=2626991 RepID=UPI0006FAC6BB|nr:MULTISPECIES: nucleoside-diphosphate sugar epimerase/dehydratase [unclassified Roseateles]KQW42100.1 polysaccharide biosynthesis protein [Pelomonas sp. Root405]KRA67703.1 polysaccharide biosynthesis protein [Pelomonas sp. Root662]
MNWQFLDTLLTRLRAHREAIALALDVAVVVVAWQATYLFRLGFERWFAARPAYDGAVLLGLLLIYAIAFRALRVPKGMWRFSGFGEVKRLALACASAGLVAATLVQMARLYGVPRAVLALHPLFTLMLLAMMRMGYRMLYEHMRSRISGSALEQRRALVMGAGDAGRLLVAGLQHTQGWVIVGFLDDAPEKQGARVAGVPVLGRLAQAAEFATLHGITHVIVAMPGASVPQRRYALDMAGKVGLPVLTVPNSEELLSGRAVNQVRDIEPEDLLGREPVELDEGGISECLNGKVVLITGAGGSIGSELCRQVARYGPSKIVLYELSELALYTIEQELSEKFPHLPLLRVIGDVKDRQQLRFIFGKYRPQIVFHAAAYKHVPLMEENAWAALRNNTLGTYHASLAALESGAERFVLISTDKAVNPTNVMGATKRAAELVVGHMAGKQGATKFMAVRFGNVLGSSGSVIPKFKEQIARGGPVTVTHPDVTRYFMTIPEAARLVVQAGAIGDSGQVFVLDMGEPIKIVDLARDMIRLSGHSSDQIRVEFTGLRRGEKLYEELLADGDRTLATPFAALRLAQLGAAGDAAAGAVIVQWLAAQGAAAEPPMSEAELRTRLKQWLPEYAPSERP